MNAFRVIYLLFNVHSFNVDVVYRYTYKVILAIIIVAILISA
jgi:hypothetical protein